MSEQHSEPAGSPQDNPFAFLEEPSPGGGDTIKSRTMGVFALVGGAALLGWALSGAWMPRKLLMLNLSMGPTLIWMGLGLIFVPLRGELMEKFQNEQSFGRMFRAMPGIWKFWLVLSFVIMAAGFVTAIVVIG